VERAPDARRGTVAAAFTLGDPAGLVRLIRKVVHYVILGAASYHCERLITGNELNPGKAAPQ